jgi:hypothetical protein
MRLRSCLGSLCLLLLVACGGSDPGAGTQTFYVEAEGQSDGSTDGTFLQVLVKQGSSSGDIVSDATVELTGEKGTQHVLTWVGVFGIGAFRKNNIIWEAGWRLRITRGSDRVEAYLNAPGITTLQEPAAGSTFNRAEGRPLVVRWKDESGHSAQTFSVDTQRADYSIARAEDPGLVQLEASRLVASTDERITVKRTNEVKLNGGVVGSYFRATTKADVRIIVQ